MWVSEVFGVRLVLSRNSSVQAMRCERQQQHHLSVTPIPLSVLPAKDPNDGERGPTAKAARATVPTAVGPKWKGLGSAVVGSTCQLPLSDCEVLNWRVGV